MVKVTEFIIKNHSYEKLNQKTNKYTNSKMTVTNVPPATCSNTICSGEYDKRYHQHKTYTHNTQNWACNSISVLTLVS